VDVVDVVDMDRSVALSVRSYGMGVFTLEALSEVYGRSRRDHDPAVRGTCQKLERKLGVGVID